MKTKFVYLRVVSESIYAFREHEINGWSTEQVIKDWFEDHSLRMFHATRDSHAIGNSSKVIEVKEISDLELKERHLTLIKSTEKEGITHE